MFSVYLGKFEINFLSELTKLKILENIINKLVYWMRIFGRNDILKLKKITYHS